jgi:tetratricopeptide (TPR) repeat protein
MSRYIDLKRIFGIVFLMKFFKLGAISFIILNCFALACASKSSHFSDTPNQFLPRFDQELFKKALSHQRKGQIEPAIVLWEKFLRKNPKSFAARKNMGLLHYANDDITQAIYHFNQGLKLRPEASQLKVSLVRALKVQAAIFEENMEYDEAIMDLRRVAELSPVTEKESIERQIEVLEDQIFEQVKKSKSMGEYQGFLKKYPHSPGNSDEARLWVENRLQIEKMNNQEASSSNSQPSFETEVR